MGKVKGVKYTGLAAAKRRERQVARKAHKEGILAGTISSNFPEPLVPEVFQNIQETYWNCLKAVPDPRRSSQIVYPLYLVLHRIIVGFLGGTRSIGILFHRSYRQKFQEGSPKTLGHMPCRAAVYKILRQIDWQEAQAKFAPLFKELGFPSDFIISRTLRDPQKILEEFQQEQARIQAKKEIEYKAAVKVVEKAEKERGMSAAKAKREVKSERKLKKPSSSEIEPEAELSSTFLSPQAYFAAIEEKVSTPSLSMSVAEAFSETPVTEESKEKIEINQKVIPSSSSIKTRYDLLVDGKVVKATYNSGIKERFVHVTGVTTNEDGSRQRFIIGATPTMLDRKGEWGAAVSILDAVLPFPDDISVLLSGDAGMCVEGNAAYLTGNSIDYLFRIKQNAGGIFGRVEEWAKSERTIRPEGDFFESCNVSGDDAHSRRLWRLSGLSFASFPGISEGFVVEKKVI